MTAVVEYPLGAPLAAPLRGGDCYARDLTQARNVFGSHRFATASACRISNGLARYTVTSASTPTLTIEVAEAIVDVDGTVYDDTTVYTDATEYTVDTWEYQWLDLGSLVIDSPVVTAVLTGVHVHRRTPEAITLRLVIPAIADAFVTLRRGVRWVTVQHGDNRQSVVTDRRVRITDSPSPTGTAASGRVYEASAAVAGFPRVVAARSPAASTDASTFAVAVDDVASTVFAAGVARTVARRTPADVHGQLFDASSAAIATREAA